MEKQLKRLLKNKTSDIYKQFLKMAHKEGRLEEAKNALAKQTEETQEIVSAIESFEKKLKKKALKAQQSSIETKKVDATEGVEQQTTKKDGSNGAEKKESKSEKVQEKPKKHKKHKESPDAKQSEEKSQTKDQTEETVGGGWNNWDQANLGDDQRTSKFLRLMGAKKGTQSGGGQLTDSSVLQKLESQFETSNRLQQERKKGRRMGLGN